MWPREVARLARQGLRSRATGAEGTCRVLACGRAPVFLSTGYIKVPHRSRGSATLSRVTDVLTQKCYRCPDCALRRRTPNAERQTPLP